VHLGDAPDLINKPRVLLVAIRISALSLGGRLGFKPESLFGDLLECARGELAAIHGVKTFLNF
jgi:hypothetical protein